MALLDCFLLAGCLVRRHLARRHRVARELGALIRISFGVPDLHQHDGPDFYYCKLKALFQMVPSRSIWPERATTEFSLHPTVDIKSELESRLTQL